MYCEKYKEVSQIIDYEFDYLNVGSIRLQMYIIVATKDSINLKAVTFFTVSSCYEAKMRTINTFNTKTQKWQKDVRSIENG